MTEDITRMQTQIAALQADRAALLIVVATLMQTHHNGNTMHLTLTAQTEMQLSESGAIGQTLDEAQRARVREFIEWLGALKTLN